MPRSALSLRSTVGPLHNTKHALTACTAFCTTLFDTYAHHIYRCFDCLATASICHYTAMLYQTTGVYTHSEEQAAAAKEAFAAVKAGSSRPVATELLPAQVFWPAEAYHQQYLSAGGTRAARAHACYRNFVVRITTLMCVCVSAALRAVSMLNIIQPDLIREALPLLSSFKRLDYHTSKLQRAMRRTSAGHPLQQQHILQLVLSFVGHKEYFYMSLVNSTWRAEYQVMALSKRCGPEYHEGSCTSYAAAFASVPRLELAIGADLRMKSTSWGKQLQHAAGRHAEIPILQLAAKLGLQLSSLVAEGAIESRDLDKLRWLCIEKGCRLPQDATLVAAKARSADILRWLQQNGFELNEHTSYAAARTANNVEVLQLLYDSGCPLNKYACNAAVAAGDLEQLQWLHAHGASLATVTVTEIAKGASLPIVRWLLKQGVGTSVVSESIMALAVKAGDSELCRRLQSAGCPWDVSTFIQALNGGSFACADPLPVLQYWSEQGELTDKELLNILLNWATLNNKRNIVVWLQQQGAE
eukprot:11921-Heterococcus_DN1.PRE.1